MSKICKTCGRVINEDEEEEMLKEDDPYRFAVIVKYANGYNRGYMVEADERKEVMQKLLAHIYPSGISNIAISEILVEGDIIK